MRHDDSDDPAHRARRALEAMVMGEADDATDPGSAGGSDGANVDLFALADALVRGETPAAAVELDEAQRAEVIAVVAAWREARDGGDLRDRADANLQLERTGRALFGIAEETARRERLETAAGIEQVHAGLRAALGRGDWRERLQALTGGPDADDGRHDDPAD